MSMGRVWNESELNAIRHNYGRLGPALLGKLMGRTTNAVAIKANDLRKNEAIAMRTEGRKRHES